MKCKRLCTWITLAMMFLTLLGCGGPITVSFETNGGEPIADIQLDGKSFLEGQLPTPEKVGYTFEGWYLDASFSSEFDIATILVSQTTLYAKWAIIQYTISFEENGGTAVTDLTQDYDTDVTEPADPTKTGFNFVGWYTEEALTNEYSFSKMPANNQVLYAKWEQITYTVTFMADGALVTTRTVNHGDALTNIPNVPEKVGFGGAWDVMDFSSITANMTVTAVYSDNYYTITFMNSLGDTIGTAQVKHGNPVTEPDVPVVDGYNFIGWAGYNFNTAPNISGPMTITATYQIKVFTVVFYGVTGTTIESQSVQWGHAANAPVYSGQEGYVVTGWDKTFDTVTSDLSVTATYTMVSYTIVFDENDGSAVLDITAPYRSVIVKPSDPTRSGYTFAGWYSDESLTTEYIFTEQSMMPLNGMTLHADWDEAQYTVSFEGNGGTVVSNRNVTYLSPYGALPTTTKTGYTFAGWYTEGEESIKVENTTVYTLTTNITLYAHWTINQYTISFEENGGSTVTNLTLDYLSAVTAPTAPTKAGYTFGGWFTESALTNEYTFATMPVGGITLFAKWNVNQYTISFDSKNGTVVSDITQNYDTAVVAPIAPTKVGYNFVTWCSDSAATTAYSFTKMPAENIILYAKWAALTDIKYTVEYYAKDLTGEGYSLLESDNTLFGATDSHVTITPKTIIGYTYESANALNVLSGTISADGGLVLKVYYTRNTDTLYKVEHWQQNILDDNYTKIETDLKSGVTGATVSSVAKMYAGFNYDPENINAVSEGTILADGSRILKVYYTRNVYTVELDYNDERSNTSFEVRHGGTLSALTDPVRTGYSFLEWVDELGAPYTTSSVVVGSLYLYASWNAEVLTITINRYFFASDGVTPISGATQIIIRSVAYGSTYTPIISITGNDFMSLEKDGVLDTDGDYSFVVTADATIDVYFKVRTIYITFFQNPTGGTPIGETKMVDYGTNLVDIVVLTPKEGYTVVWDHTIFTNLTENMTVFAFYYPNGVKTVTFMDGGTITNIISQEGSDPNIIPSGYLLWIPSKAGYHFDGWFDTLDEEWTLEEMLWASVTGNLSLYAHWTVLEPFPTPTGVAVADGTQTVTWTQGKLNDAYPAKYYILIDGTQTEVLTSNPNFSIDPVTGLASFTFADGYLLSVGSHTVIVTAVGDGINQVSSTDSVAFTFTVEVESPEAPGDEEITETTIKDYYIIEKTATTAIYTFYTGMVYNFNSGYQLTILDGTEIVTAVGSKLTTGNTAGSFRFSVKTLSTGTTKTYFGRVVTNINQFALDTNLSNYGVATLDAYEDKSLHPYLIGSLNPFHFDLKVLDNYGNRVDEKACDLIYKFSIWNSVTSTYDVISAEDSTYVTFLDNQEFQFTSAAETRTFKVEIEPKYQALQMQTETLSFVFEVNAGYNVFTNSELQVAFADFNIQNINIHSNIKCELRPDQINPDGSPINGSFLYDGNNYIGGGEGAVYARLGASLDGSDNLVVNGNYFTIDGSDLPYMNVNSDPTGVWKNVGFAQSFVVVDSRIGIFNYAVDPNNYTNDNSFVMNNLTIIGNTVTPSVNYNLSPEEIASAEALMSLNSGGYNGIVLKSGTNHFNNVNIGMTVMGFFSTSLGFQSDGITETYMYMNFVHIYESWASSFLGYAISGVNISNCNIDTSGGAAIHIEDAYPDGNDPEVFIDTSTTIDNWISGQEAWFKVYGMTTTVTTLKAAIEDGISDLGKTIIDTRTNRTTGLQTEMINFIMFQLPREGAYTMDGGVYVSGSQVSFNIPDANGTDTNIHRAFNFMDTDPRASGNPKNFVFPVGYYSDLSVFGSAVGSLMSEYGVTSGQAGSIVSIDAFFNLRALNPYLAGAGVDSLDMAAWVANNAATYGGVPGAINAFRAGNGGLPMPPQPSFLEVQATFDGKVTGGVASIILGLYDPEA